MTEVNAVEQDAAPSSKRLLDVPESGSLASGGVDGDEGEVVRDDELLAGDELTTEYRPQRASGDSARITDPYRQRSQQRELSPELPRQRRLGGPPPMPSLRSKEQPMAPIPVGSTKEATSSRSERVSAAPFGPNQRFETDRPPPPQRDLSKARQVDGGDTMRTETYGTSLSDEDVLGGRTPDTDRRRTSWHNSNAPTSQQFETEHRARRQFSHHARELGDYEVSSRFSEIPRQSRIQDLDDLREGDALLGRYRVTRIAVDGVVFRVDVTRIGLGSAAQILLLSANAPNHSEAREHFVRTGRMVAQLQSEHVARVVELGISASTPPYIITERHGYADLSELIRVRGALGVTDAVDYAIQISEALAEAHSQGVIHGSLQPANVFISEGADGTPLAKLAGFGAPAQWSLNSTYLGTSLQQSQGATRSKLSYLAPEQIRSPGALDASSDIWSLGIILHEMLLGMPAFRGNSSAGTLAMIAADVAPSIAAVRSDVSRTLESVVMRCLEKRPEARYESVIDVARALQPFGSPESETIVERIVRIGARGQRAPSGFVRPQNALVRVPIRNGLGNGATHSVPGKLPATLAPLHLGVLAGTVVLLGAIAGVAGALAVSRSLRATASSSEAQNLKPQVDSQEDIVNPDKRETASAVVANQPTLTAASNLQLATSAPSGAQGTRPTVPSLPLTVSKALRLDTKPPVTSQVRVTRRAEVKRPEVTGDQLFNDIN
jgi:serine/threonine-protein kinase